MKRLLLICAIVLSASPIGRAQPAISLLWNMEFVTSQEAQSYTYRYYLDLQGGIVLQGVTCQMVNNVAECHAPFPTPSIGTHVIQLSAENAYGEGDKSVAVEFKYPAVPGQPQYVRVIKG